MITTFTDYANISVPVTLSHLSISNRACRQKANIIHHRKTQRVGILSLSKPNSHQTLEQLHTVTGTAKIDTKLMSKGNQPPIYAEISQLCKLPS